MTPVKRNMGKLTGNQSKGGNVNVSIPFDMIENASASIGDVDVSVFFKTITTKIKIFITSC